MTEPDRKTCNADRLQECDPWFRTRLEMVLINLADAGWRPRIQEAWRSPADQLAAFRHGTSQLRWGLHCATTADGTPDALAADVLDDDRPLNPSLAYLFVLARAAEGEGLTTGIYFGVPEPIRSGLRQAISTGAHGTWPRLKTGWDPTHVQPAGLRVSEARKGLRPGRPLPSIL